MVEKYQGKMEQRLTLKKSRASKTSEQAQEYVMSILTVDVPSTHKKCDQFSSCSI